MRFPGLLLPTAYDGDNFEPRQFSSSSTPAHLKPLPNARFVSVGVFRSSEFDINGSSPRASHLAMTWGQFLDHDVTLTELAQLPEGVSCGTNNAKCPTDNPDVRIGIDIYPAFALGGLPTARCIPLRRSARSQQCEQINLITHYIDGSQVYGSDSKTAEELRDRNANLGFLDVQPFVTGESNSQPILPLEDEEEVFCRSQNPETEPCFLGLVTNT
ncbi:myeloperoxidase-like [Montipora capricornis]|uniref:myeloperoxidase-like n=1 Tax=Montipora capricornis TaxID=246305 RepID=UPI0035F21B07